MGDRLDRKGVCKNKTRDLYVRKSCLYSITPYGAWLLVLNYKNDQY